MSKIEVVLNKTGVRELLRSKEMQGVLKERAKAIQARCGDGYTVNCSKGRTRANATVSTATVRAVRSNRKHNTLVKATY